jgi:RHS repeat-associated protein
MDYTNGFLSSITDPLDTTNYSYQPDGSVQTVSRGTRSITINRNNGNLSWNCTNALGETLWTKTYDSTSGATIFMPYGQGAQEVITTPSITGNLLNITRVDPFSTTNSSWQDGTPYGMSYSGFGMASNGSTAINPYGEVTQSTLNPGGNSGNAITTTFSLPSLPSGISSALYSASIGNSFDSSTGLTQTFTQNSHTNTQTISPEGLWMGGSTAYGQPFQTWGAPGYSGNNITRSLSTGAGSVNMTFGPTGELVSRVFPDGTSESFTHHADGAVSTWSGPNGTINFSPNEYGEATESGTYGTIGHDNAGQVNTISDATGSCTVSHTFGKIATVSYNSGILNGDSITRTYYPNGLLESVSLPGSKSASYTYNADGSPNTVTTTAGITGTYSNYCTVNGQAQDIGFGPLSVTASFDGLGRNTGQSSTADTVTWGYSHQYDADSHCPGANTPQGSWTYGYDGNGFIHSAVGGGQTLNYSFDSAGRPTGATDYRATVQVNSGNVNVVGSVTPGAAVTINGTATTVSATTGQFDQIYTPTPNTWQTYIITGSLTASGTSSIAQQMSTVFVPPLSESLGYNTAGDLGDDARWSYGWNGLDQLTSITENNPYTAATATRINCVYDLQGRRVQKTVSIGGKVSKVTTTLWDAWRPVMEIDYSGTTTTVTAQRWYTWGPDVSGDIDGSAGIGGLVEIMEKEGNATIVSLPIYDGIGNIVGLVDESTGVQVASYSYGPFGELLAEYGPRANMCPFRFQTKLYDPENGYYYFGKRYYNPKTQTWISRDPIREDGGVNLYAYCEDQPVGNFDPIGEATIADYEDGISERLGKNDYMTSLQSAIIAATDKRGYRIDGEQAEYIRLLRAKGKNMLLNASASIQVSHIQAAAQAISLVTGESLNDVLGGLDDTSQDFEDGLTLARTGRAGELVASWYAGKAVDWGIGKLIDGITGRLAARSAAIHIAPYGTLTDELAGTGLQANHLNQQAVFGSIIPEDEGLAVAMRGNAFTDIGSPHFDFHLSLEEFWAPFRRGGSLFGQLPTNAEYSAALETALIRSGYTPAQAASIAEQAEAQRASFGLFLSLPVPRIPGRLPQVRP